MGTIAKGEITLTTVNDAYTVSLTKSSFVINADFDGSNPKLSGAYTDITIKRGDKEVKFSYNISRYSNDGILIVGDIPSSVSYLHHTLRLYSIPNDLLEGSAFILLTTDDGYSTTVNLSYTVVRETSMLDWVQEWNNNRTVIGSESIVTPKIFAGTKDENSGKLTGVFIGPVNSTAGIYGYKDGIDVFHINGSDAVLGGWLINTDGIYSSGGKLRLYSDGSIASFDSSNEKVWVLNEDGSAMFAKENVLFNADGTAYFKGEIQASTGIIGGWKINNSRLLTDQIALCSDSELGLYLSPASNALFNDRSDYEDFIDSYGGLYLKVKTDSADFAAYNTAGRKLFKIKSGQGTVDGAECFIGGWNFDPTGLWLGNKNNTQQAYTDTAGSITIGTSGLRGSTWRIDTSGEAAFANGMVVLNDSRSLISGWQLNTDSLSSSYIKISNAKDTSGLYIGSKQNELLLLSDTDAVEAITTNGGIYLANTSNGCELQAVLVSGKQTFRLGSKGTSKIAGWSFDNEAIYSGSKCITAGSFAENGSITIGTSGLRGSTWFIDADGSGKLAGGNIKWSEDGKVTFSDEVQMSWKDGINVAQMIAYGQMLYRDPEFTLDKKNGTSLYQNNAFDYCTFEATQLLTAIRDIGLVLKGKGTVTYLDILHADGTVNTVWTGSTTLNPDNSVNLTGGPIITPFNQTNGEGDIVRIKVQGEDAYIQAENYNDESKSLGWVNLMGNNTIIGSQVITTKREIVEDGEAPNSTQKVVQFTNTRWITPTDARLGGFCFANQSRANAKFIVKIVAKIPINWCIENYHNQYGTDCSTKWIGSKDGTGKYEEYMCIVSCGSSGTFSTVNYFALRPKNGWTISSATNEWSTNIKVNDTINYQSRVFDSVVWCVAYATVFDATSSDKMTTTIDKNGIYTGTLRADQIIAGSIDATKIEADVIISNGNAWGLNKDGSGHLANGNISWDSNGNSEFKGEITAASGNIGQFKIDQNGLYQGDPTKWSDNTYKQNLASIVPGTIKLQSQVGYSQAGDVANIKVAIGDHADPDEATNQGGGYCKSAGYFYRQMNDIDNYYYPAVQIISDNVINRDVALLTKGAIVCNGGYVGGGRFLNADTVNVLDLSFGSIQLISNTTQARQVYLPSLSNFKQVFNNDTSSTNALITSLKLISQYNNTYHFSVASQFGVSTLPSDFATQVTFRVRTGSQNITLKGIYNHNEAQTDYELASGDSVTLLITKADGFRYQILNHSY